MKFLLNEGFQMPFSRAHGMTREVVDVCGNSTGNYAGLLAKGVRAVEVERGIGAHFPPILQHRCPEQVVFMTVLRDPIAKQIRARWDFRAQKMGTFTLPSTCGHVVSFLSLGGYSHAGKLPCTTTYADLANAKSVLKQFASVCITERYQDCPLIMASGMKLKMTAEDIDVFKQRYLQTIYPSQDATGHIPDYTEMVMANGTSKEKDWVRQVQELLAFDKELYDFARRLSHEQFTAARRLFHDAD